MKSRVAARTLPGVPGTRCWAACYAKMVPKRCLFEKPENRRWLPKTTLYKSSALGPSKNDSRERFWKNMKKQWNNYRKINVFLILQNNWKVLKNKYVSWFWVIPKDDEKDMPQGTSQVMFLDPKWRHGPPRFDLSSDFWRSGVMPKNDDSWTPYRWSPKS